MCVVTFDWNDNDAVEKVKHYKKHGKTAWAVIEVTNSCNLNCIWCYAAAGKGSGLSHHMSPENLKRLITLLKANGVRQITFSGGEPTVYPHIKYAVRLAKENGFVVHMNTNGYILDRKMAQDLSRAGLSQVQINIDSLEAGRHDRIRGMEKSFERAVQALKNAKAAGMTTVSQTVITRETEKEIFAIFRFARSLGIDRSRVWDITPSGTAASNMSLLPSDYIKTLKKLAGFARKNGARRIESGEPLFPNGFRTGLEVSGGFCTAARGAFMTISSSGDVFPCVTQRTPMYNVFDNEADNRAAGKLFEFHLSKIKQFSASVAAPPACASCKASEKCSGGCMTRRKFSGCGDYNCSLLKGECN